MATGYHLDAKTYGNVSLPVNQTQSGQFIRGTGDIGRGLYRDYNPTGPLPASFDFEWDGLTLQNFRADWEQRNRLNFGATWFTMDLPLNLLHNEMADADLFPQREPAEFVYAVEIGNSGTTFGFREPKHYSALGALNGSPFMRPLAYGLAVARLAMGSTSFNVNLANQSNTDRQLAAPNDALIAITFLETDESVLLTWSGAGYTRGVAAIPDTFADWTTATGETRTVSLRLLTQAFQRYACHFTEPYAAQSVGYDRWRVTFNVEVDLTPQVVPLS